MSGGATGRRRVHVGRTILIGVVGSTIPLIGNVVASLVSAWSPAVSWVAVPVTAVVFGVIATFATAHVERTVPDPPAGPPAPSSAPPPRAPGRAGVSLPVGILVTALVLAAGGWAVAAGTRYAVGWITGNEDGPNRLVEPVSGGSSGVRLTVTEVRHTQHFTRVTASVDNGLRNSITLPLFQNCTLRGADGTTLQADPFRSSAWAESVAAGAKGQAGTIVFPGHLPNGVATASLSFATVFVAGFDGPRSLTVSGLKLRPPPP